MVFYMIGRRFWISQLVAPVAFWVTACSPPSPSDGKSAPASRNVVGDMDNTSYYRVRDLPRVNARGEMVRMEAFAGQFVWAHYAAPWCTDSPPQTKVLQSLHRRDVTVLTVMSSEMGGYGYPATHDTAADWAARFGLDPVKVVAADLTYLKLPRHVLFSPEGHTLFEHTGFMSQDEIASTFEQYRNDWLRWKEFGERAHWMR